MKFEQPLIHGNLVKRYKRFLTDITLDNGQLVTAHCTNSGSMKTCLEDDAEVYISKSANPNRKLPYTWEMIKINGNWVGINTFNPNKLALEILSEGWIKELPHFDFLKPEVKFGDSRFDVYGEAGSEKVFVEVKNVTYKDGIYARFPDAVTTRGLKHLHTLVEAKAQGYRTIMLYIIQRMDVEIFTPAWNIDSNYGKGLVEAHSKGVEIIPLQVKVTPKVIEPYKILPYSLDL
ncbi:MAG: DNA/RNA nuclease SfsA [Bacteroidales bacterium]|nr:DNA/RNA nuclease SfsA [Bacteroidales bacterium]